MNARKTPSEEASTLGDDAPREVSPSAWIRYYETYPIEDVQSMLVDLKHPYGIAWKDYFDYVQVIPTTTTVKVQGERATIDRKIPTFVLYMSVAGRYRMLADIAALEDWRVEFVPQQDGVDVPGLIHDDDTLVVYRVTCSIFKMEQLADGTWSERRLGSRTGVSKRVASDMNSYEKAETAATGRAIAAWGIGVLPGSGVASADELRDVQAQESGGQRPARDTPGNAIAANTQRETKDDLIDQIKAITVELCGVTGADIGDATARNAAWLTSAYQIDALDETTGAILWERVNHGQALQLRNYLRTTLQKVHAVGQVSA